MVYQLLQEEIARGKQGQRGPNPTPPHFASVRIDIGTGDNNASHVLINHDLAHLIELPEHIDCMPPFTCYSEQDLLTNAVTLKTDDKGWGRIWFLASNTDTVSIPAPYVAVFVENPDNGMSIFRMGTRSDAAAQMCIRDRPKVWL